MGYRLSKSSQKSQLVLLFFHSLKKKLKLSFFIKNWKRFRFRNFLISVPSNFVPLNLKLVLQMCWKAGSLDLHVSPALKPLQNCECLNISMRTWVTFMSMWIKSSIHEWKIRDPHIYWTYLLTNLFAIAIYSLKFAHKADWIEIQWVDPWICNNNMYKTTVFNKRFLCRVWSQKIKA